MRHFGQAVPRRHGGRLLRINLREAGVPASADIGLACDALAGLAAIDSALLLPSARPGRS